MKRRVVSAMLATMMLFSNATPVLAAEAVKGQASNNGGNFDVSARVESPVYKISVPTTLDFYIDPFQQLAAGQITSDDFVIINKSNVALKVGATVTVAGKDSNVTLKNAAADVTETTTDKLAYIEAEIPSVIVETNATGAKFVQSDDFTTEYTMYKGTVGGETKYYTTTNQSAVTDEANVTTEMVETTGASGTYATSKKVAIDTTNGTDLTFALDKANYIDVYTKHDDTTKAGVAFKDVAADGKGTAVFRFNGKVNTTAAWADGDIKGNIAYTFTGLTPELYTTNAAKVGTDAHAYVPSIVNEAPSFSNSDAVGVINYSEGSGDLALDEIVKIEMTNGGTAYDGFHAGLDYWEDAVVDADAGTITFDNEFISCFATDSEVATITYKTKDSTTEKTATVTVKLK